MFIFGQRLKAKRLELGMTVSECASELSISQPAWTFWENGSREPKFKYLLQICELFKTDANWLLGLKDHDTAPVVKVNGSGNVVAAGTGAKAAKTVTSAVQAACKACPYKKALAKLQKAGLQIPGL